MTEPRMPANQASSADDGGQATGRSSTEQTAANVPTGKPRSPRSLSNFLGARVELPGKLTPQIKAQLLYDYCLASEKKVGESVHSLFAIAEHYAGDSPEELEQPEIINGIPPFFAALTKKEKSDYCYNQVTEGLSIEAMPVTVESLLATKRTDPNDPTSSYAGRFVRRVTNYVTFSLLIILSLYLIYIFWNDFASDAWQINTAGVQIQWISWFAFGCIGALVHLLNHALTTTRLQTFEMSEERKIWPRLLLGGMFGFVLPWILSQAGPLDDTSITAAGTLAAFFGGYSVRFSIAFLERLLAAVLPETRTKA